MGQFCNKGWAYFRRLCQTQVQEILMHSHWWMQPHLVSSLWKMRPRRVFSSGDYWWCQHHARAPLWMLTRTAMALPLFLPLPPNRNLPHLLLRKTRQSLSHPATLWFPLYIYQPHLSHPPLYPLSLPGRRVKNCQHPLPHRLRKKSRVPHSLSSKATTSSVPSSGHGHTLKMSVKLSSELLVHEVQGSINQLVMCWAGPEAMSPPSPAHSSTSQAWPRQGLEVGLGLAWNFRSPSLGLKPGLWHPCFGLQILNTMVSSSAKKFFWKFSHGVYESYKFVLCVYFTIFLGQCQYEYLFCHTYPCLYVATMYVSLHEAMFFVS